MPLVVACCLLIVFVLFLAMKRNREYLLLCALALSLVVYLVFVLMYIAKKGGIGSSMRTVLFLTDFLRTKLQYARLTLGQQGYGLAIGRALFPMFFVQVALYYSSDRRFEWLRTHSWVTAVLPALSLVIYQPAVFTSIAREPLIQRLIVYGSLGWLAVYLLLGVFLLAQEPRNVRIRYIRATTALRCVMLISVAALFALYCPQDPAQVYLFYRDNYIAYRGLWYLNPYLSPATYLVVLVTNVVSLLVGSAAMMSVARMEWSEDQDDVRLQRKYDAASMGGSVFVHGIKNQLLANRVLGKRLWEQLESETPDLDQLRACAQQLTANNEGLLTHVNELYKSFKSNALTMRPCSLLQVVQGAVDDLCKKYPAALVELDLADNLFVLADETHLRAALVNILANGWEATLAAGEPKPLSVTCYEKQRVSGICIRDQGVGISQYELGRIFEPFYSSKNSNSNWGLGLYYARTIVKKHMGSMKIESAFGSGTSIYILLPKLLPDHTRPNKRKGGIP